MLAQKQPNLEYGELIRRAQNVFNTGCDHTLKELSQLPDEESKEANHALMARKQVEEWASKSVFFLLDEFPQGLRIQILTEQLKRITLEPQDSMQKGGEEFVADMDAMVREFAQTLDLKEAELISSGEAVNRQEQEMQAMLGGMQKLNQSSTQLNEEMGATYKKLYETLQSQHQEVSQKQADRVASGKLQMAQARQRCKDLTMAMLTKLRNEMDPQNPEQKKQEMLDSIVRFPICGDPIGAGPNIGSTIWPSQQTLEQKTPEQLRAFKISTVQWFVNEYINSLSFVASDGTESPQIGKSADCNSGHVLPKDRPVRSILLEHDGQHVVAIEFRDARKQRILAIRGSVKATVQSIVDLNEDEDLIGYQETHGRFQMRGIGFIKMKK